MPVLPSEDWHASTLPIHVHCHRMNQLGTWLRVVEHSDGTITRNTTLHILNLTSVINKILLMKYNNLLATLEQPSTFLPCYRRLEGYKRNKQKRSFLRSHQLHSTSPFFQLTTLQRWVLPRLLFDQSCFSVDINYSWVIRLGYEKKVARRFSFLRSPSQEILVVLKFCLNIRHSESLSLIQ